MSEKSLVAIVDDDRAFCESMQRLLRSLGYSVASFPSAMDFLASSEFSATACLIADVQMPGMTGVELFRRLISIGTSIPTILITAYPNEEDRNEMLRLGAECYLRKPLVEKELIACLRSACARGNGPEAPS